MQITSEFDVAQPTEAVWEFFNDIPMVAACLPGADISEQVDDDHYKGTVVISAGPVKLDFAGEASIRSRDEANKTIVVDASGADVKGRGQATLGVEASLAPAGISARSTCKCLITASCSSFRPSTRVERA